MGGCKFSQRCSSVSFFWSGRIVKGLMCDWSRVGSGNNPPIEMESNALEVIKLLNGEDTSLIEIRVLIKDIIFVGIVVNYNIVSIFILSLETRTKLLMRSQFWLIFKMHSILKKMFYLIKLLPSCLGVGFGVLFKSKYYNQWT